MTRSIELEPSPDVQVLGGSAVVVKGAAAMDAYRLMVEGIATVRRRDGIDPSPRLLRTVAALKIAADAARSIGGADIADIADVRTRPTSPQLHSGLQVGVKEVARMTGLGERQARRLAPTLGGTKTRNGWAFDRGVVQAYLDMQEGVR